MMPDPFRPRYSLSLLYINDWAVTIKLSGLLYKLAIRSYNKKREINYLGTDYLAPHSSWKWCLSGKTLEKGSVLEAKIMKKSRPNRKKIQIKQRIIQQKI